MRLDPKYRLNKNMRKRIRESLKVINNGKSWQSLVDYTASKLRKHLEAQFQTGMTWENYGEWHVDHIIPISAFNFTKPEDIDFKRCWALSNLQPMWADKNMAKSDRLESHFQPSFSF